MLFSFNSSLLFRCFCMFQWLGSELCLEFFILYYTVHAILYSTAMSAWGSGPRILYFQHCNICSCWEACLPWNDGLSLNTFSVSYWCHMTVFLLCDWFKKTVLISDWPKACCLFPIGCKFWLRGKFIFFNLDIQAEGSELQASASLFYSLMPSFSSMLIFGVAKILLDLLDVTKTVWSTPSGVPSVRRLEEPLYWVFLSPLCLTSVGSLYVLYDI